MAPTTRAVAKRKREDSLTQEAIKRSKEEIATKQGNAQLHNTHAAMLRLPAEIRNHIYSFCVEFPHDEDSPLLIKQKSQRKSVRQGSGRRYVALTQVCQQMRSEFRPLWLRDSSVRIMFKDLHPFIHTYYPRRAHFENAPRFLCISWDHSTHDSIDDVDDEDMEHVQFDIDILLELLAHSPTITIRFVCHKLAECDLPNEECHDCGHSLHCGCGEDCEHEDACLAAIGTLHEEYSYLEELNKLLANRTEAWLRLIHTPKVYSNMNVQFTFEIGRPELIVYIQFEKGPDSPGFDKKNLWNNGVDFLKRMGMLDLPDGLFTFVVGESTDEHTRYYPGAPLELAYNQVHISPWKDLDL